MGSKNEDTMKEVYSDEIVGTFYTQNCLHDEQQVYEVA